MIIWAEIWCWTWSECGCGRVVYCHECKCWLTLREGNVLVLLEFFFDMIVKQGHLKIHIESVQAKVEYIYVICVNIKLQHREFWRLIMNQSMKMSSTCNLCEYKRKQQGHLNTHIESVHKKVRYHCIQCHKEFRTQGYLKIYIESVQLPKWEI